MAGPAYDIARYRAQIPILGHSIPLNNCSQAPLTDVTLAAAERYLESWNTRGMDWDAWMQEVEAGRRAFASFINASPDEVGVVTSVSHAASAIATALDFDRGRNVVVASEAEFPTVGHVWLAEGRRGARVQWVPVHNGAVALDDYARAIDERTAIVSSTHSYYLNGFIQDVRAIGRLARNHGALSFVDCYQSLGAVPIDVKALEIDILASGTLKYLMGTPGIAYLYVRRDLIDRFEPLMTGWFGRANPFAFGTTRLDWSRTASRFDSGTPPLFSAYVSRAAIEWLAGVGQTAIHEWTQSLSCRLIDGAAARDLTIHGPGSAAPKAPTTAIVCADSHAAETALRSRGIIASSRGPVLRLAPHFFNTEEEIDRALDALAEVLRA
jgi:selenocysteine lyase/cysteine desulfurase